MFVDKTKKYIKIYPIVWVKEIDTLFFENACGSGTIATSMVETWLTKKSSKYQIMQQSGKFLETEITIKDNIIKKAILKGEIKTDKISRSIKI